MAEDGYQQVVLVGAPRERAWDAVGTVDGPRHWWTTTVSGSAEVGGELRFGFAGLPEEMVMLVVASRRPASVTWRCVAHSRDQEWAGTQLSFELADRGPGGCELTFRHSGLPGDVVADGWRHFLASLADYAEGRPGHPFGALSRSRRSHGLQRLLTFPDGHVIRELTVAVDDGTRRLAYSVIEGADTLPCHQASNRAQRPRPVRRVHSATP